MQKVEGTITPTIPKNSSLELVAYVRTAYASHGTATRAMHYANALETKTPSGVESFTGWCRFDSEGRRTEALSEGEHVFEWELPTHSGNVKWIKHPIRPKVEKGQIKQFLVSFQGFGQSTPYTMTAYYANDYKDDRTPTNRGVSTYNGWVLGHPAFGLRYFVTIGDLLVAWAEFPDCGIEE